MSGTVNISRGLFTSEAFRSEPLTEREAWVWLIMAASWKDRTVRAGDYVAETKRGQLAHSVRYMAGAWKWTAAKVQRYLKRLEKLKMIRVETDTGVSVITVCKYEEYQNNPKVSDTDAIQDRYRTDTEKNKDVIREEGNVVGAPAPSKKRATRLSENWVLPVGWMMWATDEGWPEHVVRLEAEKFKDYWHSVSGQKATKLDWKATWRNWMRNSRPQKQQKRSKPSGNEIANQVAASFGEMDNGEGSDSVVPLLPARHTR